MKNFKNQMALLIFPSLLLGMFMTSCSKDDGTPAVSYTCATCKTTPDALVVNDANVKGVYKGVVVGSTGTIAINIQNGNNTITATMVLDGVSVAFTSNVAVVDGQTYVAPFTGTFNGSAISMTFSVGLGGANPTITSSSIPGHPNTIFLLSKETSNSLIEAFQGTYTYDGQTGVFNIVIARSVSKWGYAEKNNQTGATSSGSGTLNASGQLIDKDSKIVATITSDLIQGSSTNSSGKKVVIDGKRTL
ncbi:hypothetical protein [Flavobacterium cellulosilyticum]|uniref:Lipocalin-like domain-containing protein n=1 Tax=Flavobacterium cellulosilyticum TaxID=2541731 RepID=A0A4R5CHQ1_9FLAO|nr:hypothetical protein [Flavobacterium cellulosilyticum]TDD98586.1 hypothetical protein E0F76_05525 [Flavobacterium cellulosilyticum]